MGNEPEWKEAEMLGIQKLLEESWVVGSDISWRKNDIWYNHLDLLGWRWENGLLLLVYTIRKQVFDRLPEKGS